VASTRTRSSTSGLLVVSVNPLVGCIAMVVMAGKGEKSLTIQLAVL
jgi:hypothetical protein